MPLLVIPPIEFDFEMWTPKRTVEEHAAPFSRLYHKKWKTRPAWIDVDPSLQSSKMDSGVDVVTHVFSELRKFKARAVPVASLDHTATTRAAVASVKSVDKLGVALRARCT